MESHGITAAELSRRTGISKQVLSLWLGGSEPRHIEQVQKVAKIFEVSIEELCFGSPLKESEDILSALTGDGWATGTFEIKFRRLKK